MQAFLVRGAAKGESGAKGLAQAVQCRVHAEDCVRLESLLKTLNFCFVHCVRSLIVPLAVAGLVRSALDVSLSLGRAAAGVRGPLKAWRRKALQSIFEAGNSLRLQFPLEDLGFCYTAPGSAVCLPGQAASSRAPAALDAASDTAQQNVSAQQGRGLDYVQNTQPGSRLPHLELKLLASKRHSDGRVTQLSHTESSQVEPQGLHADSPAGAGTVRRGVVGKSMDQQFTSLSTHDLLDAGSTSLLMLLGQGRAAAVWAAAARRVDPRLQTFNIVQIFDGPYCRESLRTETVVQDAYVRTAQDVSSTWKTLRQVCNPRETAYCSAPLHLYLDERKRCMASCLTIGSMQ